MKFIWVRSIIPCLTSILTKLYSRNCLYFRCCFMHFNMFLVHPNILVVFKKLLGHFNLFLPNSIDIFFLLSSSFWIVVNTRLMNPAVVSTIIPIIMNVILYSILRVFDQSCRFDHSKSVISLILDKDKCFIWYWGSCAGVI